MAQKRIAGIAFIRIDGKQYESSGSFTINTGEPMREGVVGTARVAGFKETPQIPTFEGKLLKTAELSVVDITSIVDSTVTIVDPTGGQHVLREAYFAGEGTYDTGEGEIAAKFEGAGYEYIAA